VPYIKIAARSLFDASRLHWIAIANRRIVSRNNSIVMPDIWIEGRSQIAFAPPDFFLLITICTVINQLKQQIKRQSFIIMKKRNYLDC
jgi:hypothetical protein